MTSLRSGEMIQSPTIERILAETEPLDPHTPTCAYARIHSDRTIGPVYVAEAFDDLAADLEGAMGALDELAADVVVREQKHDAQAWYRWSRNRATLAAIGGGK